MENWLYVIETLFPMQESLYPVPKFEGFRRLLQFEIADVMANREFGHISGIPVRTAFATRHQLSLAGIHRPTMAGISGTGSQGADSIVLSGGYEDDRDFGSLIIYTGHGGRDANTGKQVADQTLTKGNLALAVSQIQGLPVRVTRALDISRTIRLTPAIDMTDSSGLKIIGVTRQIRI